MWKDNTITISPARDCMKIITLLHIKVTDIPIAVEQARRHENGFLYLEIKGATLNKEFIIWEL